MFSGTCWWLGLCFLLATPCCSWVTNPDYYTHSLRLPEDAQPSQSEGLYKGPSPMGFYSAAVRPNSYSRGYTKSAAVNMKPAGSLPPSPAGQQSRGSSYGGNDPNQGSLSSWGVRPVDSSRNYGPSANTAVDGSTSSANHRPVLSQSTGNTHYWPVAGQSKGSVGYRPTNQPLKAEVNSGQYRPYSPKPALGKDDVKQVVVRPNSPAWSAKPSSAAVVGSTSGVSYKPVTGPSKGSMSYRPANKQLKPSTSSGQHRPYPAKPALGKDDIKQVLVRPNSPAWSAKPFSAGAIGSTSGMSYKPVTGPSKGGMSYRPSSATVGGSTSSIPKFIKGSSKGSMSYRPANQHLKASTSFGQNRPYSAKPALGKDEDVKQVLNRPNSPACCAKPFSTDAVGSTSGVSYKPVTGPSKGGMSYRPANQQLMPSTSSGQYRPYSAKPAVAKQVPFRPRSSASSAKMPSGSFGSPQAQWAQAEVSSSTYRQAGQATLQSQATSTSTNSQNSIPQSHRGDKLENPAYSAGASQQGEDSVLTVIPSHLGIGVIETVLPAERRRLK